MTDKEFRRLKRSDLIEIIYRLQENEEKYRDAIVRMRRQLADRQTKIENAGSVAEAAMALSGVFESAQDAADRYLSEIQQMHTEAKKELEQAHKDAEHILAEARQRAKKIADG